MNDRDYESSIDRALEQPCVHEWEPEAIEVEATHPIVGYSYVDFVDHLYCRNCGSWVRGLTEPS